MVKCLNPWDPQSKRQYCIDGVFCALNARNRGGGQACGVCYAVDVRHLRIDGTVSGTLQAKSTGGHSLNYINPVIYEQDE